MLTKFRRGIALGLIAVSTMLAGCAAIAYKPMPAAAPGPDGHRVLAIFLDGTHNDEQSDTNVKRLHSLVTLQKRSDIASLYVEGVGVGDDVLGMMTGFGFAPRVEIAYEFILNHYQPGDRIFLFGFSRGAYEARVLTSMLYHAGLVKSDTLSHKDIADIVFSAVKFRLQDVDAPESVEPGCESVCKAAFDATSAGPSERDRLRIVHCRLCQLHLKPSPPVTVELLGLWDTVEALGYREGISKLAHKLGVKKHEVNVDNANARYGDKLCNVREVRHAMSIDDNREWIFTPRLLTRQFLFNGCDSDYPSALKTSDGRVDTKHIKEVWFAGAHSDVGGGYPDSQLSGVSLNWMLGELRGPPFNLVPADAAVREDPFGTSHDPETDEFSLVYHAVNRDIAGYALQLNTVAGFRGTLCVHESVFDRRSSIPPKSHESDQLVLHHPGVACLVEDNRPDLSYRDRLWERRDRSSCREERCAAAQDCQQYIDVRKFPYCQQEVAP